MRMVWRILLVLLVLLVAAAGVVFYLFNDRVQTEDPLARVRETRRELRRAALEDYLAHARASGSFLPQDDVTISIRESFLQSALEASLPFHNSFEHGKYLARLDSAQVDMLGGLSLVRLTGRGWLARDTTMSVDLLVEGTLGVRGLDSLGLHIVPRLEVTNIQVIRAGPRELRTFTNPVAVFFGRQKAQEWNALAAPFELPLQLEPSVKVPAVSGDISIPETIVPLPFRVSSVVNFGDREVVSLELLPDSMYVGPVAPREEGLIGHRAPRGGPPVTDEELEALTDSVSFYAARDSMWRTLVLVDRDVALIAPHAVLEDLLLRVTCRLRGGVRVDFSPDIDAKIDEPIKVKVLGKKVGAGRIKADIHVQHLAGTLHVPRGLDLASRSSTTLEAIVPIQVAEGRGTAMFHAEWDPAAVVSVVCHSFTTDQTLTGRVLPKTYDVHTSVHFGFENNRIVGRPLIRRDKIVLSLDLDERSWAKIYNVFAEQDRFGRCGIGIDPYKLVGSLKKFAAKGIKIRLPGGIIPTFSLPIKIGNTYRSGDVEIEALAYGPHLEFLSSALVLAMDADLRVVQQEKPGDTADSTGVGSPPPP